MKICAKIVLVNPDLLICNEQARGMSRVNSLHLLVNSCKEKTGQGKLILWKLYHSSHKMFYVYVIIWDLYTHICTDV
jgi:ABC-type uncharacterized transport system ATPase subunit